MVPWWRLLLSMFCWVVARSRRLRFARRFTNNAASSSDVRVPVQALYTASVLEALNGLEGDLARGLLARVAEARAASSSAVMEGSLWTQASDDLHGKVIGFMVLQPEMIKQPWDHLTGEQHELRDFWMVALYHEFPLVFSQIARAACGREGVPLHVQGNHLARHAQAWFFHASDDSLTRLLQAFPEATDFASSLCVYIPVPHALLMLEQKWLRCAFPRVLRGRKARAWVHGRDLLSAPDLPLPAQTFTAAEVSRLMADWAIDEIGIIKLAGNLHSLLNPTTPEATQEATTCAQRHMLLLHKLRERMLLRSAKASQHVYDLDHVLQCVLIAAELRAPNHLHQVLKQSLRVSVPDKAIRAHFEAILNQGHAAPSRTTSYRHRLIVLIGFQRAKARLLDEMLDQSRGSGIIRWSTMDSSPHKGYDFVLQGHATMLLDDLPEAWRCAQVLLSGEGDERRVADSVHLLKPKLQLVPSVPVAVGSGRASVPHKVRAAAHSERLSANSWAQVAVLMNSTFTRTGDLGTESRLCGFRGNLDDLIGPWILHEDGFQVDEPGFQFEPLAQPAPQIAGDDNGNEHLVLDMQAVEPVPESVDQRPPYRLDFSSQIFIAGLLHISHNLTRDLELVLQHWDTYLIQLTHVCRLLRQPWSRQRLVRTCMQRPPWAACVGQLEQFDAAVYAGRWGTSMDAVIQLVPVLELVRQVWNLDRYQSKSGSGSNQTEDAGEGEASRQLSLEIVNAALTSDLFVAYSHAMRSIAETILHIQRWSESCPCKAHSSDKAKQTCPLKTRRAPELASGEFWIKMGSVFDVAHGSLLAHRSLAILPEAEKQLVLADFSAARQHVDLSLRVKLSHWRQLPYVLFGLGHESFAVRQRCAKRSLQLYDFSESCRLQAQAEEDPEIEPEKQHHYVSALLCHPGTEARRQMDQLAEGTADVHELPLLLPWAARFRFVPVAERWVEGLHASAKRHSRAAPHAGPVHLAFESSLNFLQDWLEENERADVDGLSMLAHQCMATRNIRRCLTVSGMFNHPVVQQLLEQGGVSRLERQGRHQCVEVLFHCDSNSHFRPLPQAVQVRNVLVAPVNWSLPAVRNESLQDELWAKYVLLQLKEQIATQQAQRGQDQAEAPLKLISLVVISLNSAASPLALQTLVNPPAQRATDAIEDAFQFLALEDSELPGPHVDGNAPVADVFQNVSFFRVAQLNPGRAQTVAGISRVQGQDTLVVELLPTLSFDSRSLEAFVGIEGVHSDSEGSGSLFVLDRAMT